MCYFNTSFGYVLNKKEQDAKIEVGYANLLRIYIELKQRFIEKIRDAIKTDANRLVRVPLFTKAV